MMSDDSYPGLYRCADAASLKAQSTYLLYNKVEEMLAAQQNAETELDAMLPSILDRAFKGEL